jgi:hypothetical protein
MEEQQKTVTTTKAGLRYGLMVTLASIIFSTVLQLLNINGSGASSLGFIILIVGMVFGMKYYKDWNGGIMSFGQGFNIGALIAVINGLISSVFAAFYIAFIDKSAMTAGLEKARQDMEKRGMSDAEIDKAMEMSAMFTSPTSIFIFGFIISVVVGIIIALIISAIMKKEKNAF